MAQEICFFKGFTKNQALRAMALLKQESGKEPMLFVPMTEAMLKLNMKEILQRTARGDMPQSPGLSKEPRVVLMGVEDKRRAVNLMGCIKQVVKCPEDTVFAMITPKALEWTLEEYIVHVVKEHEYMKRHNPEEDPDMKKL